MDLMVYLKMHPKHLSMLEASREDMNLGLQTAFKRLEFVAAGKISKETLRI